jgi:hypothetical protein
LADRHGAAADADEWPAATDHPPDAVVETARPHRLEQVEDAATADGDAIGPVEHGIDRRVRGADVQGRGARNRSGGAPSLPGMDGRPIDRAIDAMDVARVVAARIVLRQAIESPNVDQTVGLLNALAIGAGAVRQLRKVDDGWQFIYVAANADPCSALIAEAVEGALGAILDGEWDRLGVCAGDRAGACSSTRRRTGVGATAASSARTGRPRRATANADDRGPRLRSHRSPPRPGSRRPLPGGRPTVGEILDDYRRRGQVPSTLQQSDSDTFRLFGDIYSKTYEAGVLSPKVKELIALAMGGSALIPSIRRADLMWSELDAERATSADAMPDAGSAEASLTGASPTGASG